MIERERLILMVQGTQSGDDEAAAELYDTFYSDIYYHIMKTVQDPELAADLTQDTFMEILSTIGKLNEPAAFMTWAKQIAYHRCTAYFRKSHELLANTDEDGYSVFDTMEEDREEFIPGEALDKEDLKKTIREMIDALPPEQRSALMMRYFQEISVKEIAEIQGVSEGTVKSRLNYARKAVKQSVEDYEKKNNVKLHSIGILPLLLWLFRGSRSVAAGTSSASAAAGSASASVAAAGSTSAGAAAATSAAAKTGGGIATKIIAGVLAAAVTIGGAAAGITLMRNAQSPEWEAPTVLHSKPVEETPTAPSSHPTEDTTPTSHPTVQTTPTTEPEENTTLRWPTPSGRPMVWVGYGDLFHSYGNRRYQIHVTEVDGSRISGILEASYRYDVFFSTAFTGTGTETAEGTCYHLTYETTYVYKNIVTVSKDGIDLYYNAETDCFFFDDYFDARMTRDCWDPKVLAQPGKWSGIGEDSCCAPRVDGHLFELELSELTSAGLKGHLRLSRDGILEHETEIIGRCYQNGSAYRYELLFVTPRSMKNILDIYIPSIWLEYNTETNTFYFPPLEYYEAELYPE